MNPFRKTLVMQAFNKLDADGSGILDISDVKQFYNATAHPDVKAGRKTEDDVLEEFLETFELHHAMEGELDHKVTKEEFTEYYNNVSASIDNDNYFELMMNNTWRLTEAPAYTKQKAWSNVQDSPPEKSQPFATDEVFRPGKRQTTSAAAPMRTPASPTKETHALVEMFRQKLAGRGSRGIIGLGRQFRIMDDNNSRTLDLMEFQKACQDYRLNISDPEVRQLFGVFDRDNSGEVDYDEFIRAVRGPMNNFRTSLVHQAFKKLDRDGSGIVDIQDIRDVYNAKNHPDVRQGKKTEEEVLGEFLETFELHHNISDRTLLDHRVTIEEFEEYYANVSASIDEDGYFETMMSNAWKLTGSAAMQEAWAGQVSNTNFNPNHKMQYLADHHRSLFSGSVARSAPFGTSEVATDYQTAMRPGNDNVDRLKIAENTKSAGSPSWPGQTVTTQYEGTPPEVLLQKFREKLLSRGARGIIGLARQFKIMDDNSNNMLEFPEFVKAIHDYRIEVPEKDIGTLFATFDRDGNGAVDYDEFLRMVRGGMGDFRINIVKQAFEKLDKTGDGILEIEDIKGVYNPRNHPDVRMGKKTEEEVLGDFLSTFETHHSIIKGGAGRDQRVTFEEFVEYYENVSASIDDDRYFELMMKNAWNFENRTFEAGWSGDYTDAPAQPSKRKYF